MKSSPRISVVTTNKNGAKYLRETIESVMRQSFGDFEHIIVDSASTDNSLEIIKGYPHIRWISEEDNSPCEGFQKGFAMAKGEFIMVMSVSDIYSSQCWFRRCIEVLDADPEVSLVWGSAAQMNENGELTHLWQPWWLDSPPPQKRKFFAYAMATDGYLPELNYCVRRKIFLECFRGIELSRYCKVDDFFISMPTIFTLTGYLPHYIPVVAHVGRQHAGQVSEVQRDEIKSSLAIVKNYKRTYLLEVLLGRRLHKFLDGESAVTGHLSIAERIKLPAQILLIKVHQKAVRMFRAKVIVKLLGRLLLH